MDYYGKKKNKIYSCAKPLHFKNHGVAYVIQIWHLFISSRPLMILGHVFLDNDGLGNQSQLQSMLFC